MLQQIDSRIGLLVSQETHKAAQEATAQRFRDQAEDLTEWKAESRGAHVALAAEIKAERERTDRIAQAQREARSRTYLAIGTSVLSAILAIGSGLILYVVTSGGA